MIDILRNQTRPILLSRMKKIDKQILLTPKENENKIRRLHKKLREVNRKLKNDKKKKRNTLLIKQKKSLEDKVNYLRDKHKQPSR